MLSGSSELCSTVVNNIFRIYTAHDYASGSPLRSRYRSPATGGDLPFNTYEATVDANTGLPKTTKDSAGLVTSYGYDLQSRLRSVTTPDGLTTTYTYADAAFTNGIFTRAAVTAESNVIAGIGRTRSRYEYDALGRMVREKRLMESDSALRVTEYNDLGFRTSTSVWTRVPAGSSTDPIPAHKTSFENFDIFGRARTIVAPDATTTSLTFFGQSRTDRTVNVAMPGGEAPATTIEINDRFGRLIKVHEGSAPSGAFVETRYAYDAAGRLTEAKTFGDATQTRTFAYDGRGFLTEESHPELGASGNGTVHYEYDPRGHVMRKYIGSGSDGFDLEFEYDFAERPTKAKQTVGGASIKEWDYNDCTVGGAPADCDGRLQRATRFNTDPVLGNVAVEDAFTYHAATGRLTRKKTTVATTATFQGMEANLDQTWNAFGLMATQSYPACTSPAQCAAQSTPRTLTYSYTNALLTGISGWISAIGYEANGMIRSVQHSNTLSEVWAPDLHGMARPCRISAYWGFVAQLQSGGDECGVTEPGAPVWTTGRYQYDAAGNIKQMGTTTYRYDAVSRLSEVTPSGGNRETYGYDTFGNLKATDPPGQRCTVINGRLTCWFPSFLKIDPDPATNRLRTWSYDTAGNATSDGVATFQWDGVGTMRSSVRQGKELHFLYNADDERVALVERAGAQDKTTFTLRGLDNQLLRTFVNDPQSWSWKEDQIWRGASLVANLTPTATHHYALDHLGSPRAITTTSTAAVSFQTFSAFGMGGLAGGGTLMFTAHERDDAALGGGVVGWPDYMHARFYEAGSGRFVSADPISSTNLGMPQSWNRYAYALNNPVSAKDADGRQTCGIVPKPDEDPDAALLRQMMEQIPSAEHPFVIDPRGRPIETAGNMLFLASIVSPFIGDEAVGIASRAERITRYMGPGEAEVARATGEIPNTGPDGIRRPTHVTTDRPLNNATAAQQKYELPTKPTHRATVPGNRVPALKAAPDGRPKTSGGGSQAATSEPIPVRHDEIKPLRPGLIETILGWFK